MNNFSNISKLKMSSDTTSNEVTILSNTQLTQLVTYLVRKTTLSSLPTVLTNLIVSFSRNLLDYWDETLTSGNVSIINKTTIEINYRKKDHITYPEGFSHLQTNITHNKSYIWKFRVDKLTLPTRNHGKNIFLFFFNFG